MIKHCFSVKPIFLTSFPKNSYTLTHPRRKATAYDLERLAYKRLYKKYQANNIKLYWERQTEIENEFIDNYNAQQARKKQDDLTNFRTSIVTMAYATKKMNEFQSKRQGELKSRIEKHTLNEQMQKMNRKRILKLLTLESQDWFNLHNIEEAMVDKVIIPDHLYDQTDYYLKLQEKALLFEIGDYDALEKAESDKEGLKSKNKLLIPLYGEIVALVKHLKNDEPNKLRKELEFAKAQLSQTYKPGSKKIQEGNEQLEKAYNSLLAKFYEEIKKPKKQIEILRDKLILFYHLLSKWEDYTFIVKMPNSYAENLVRSNEKGEFEPEQAEKEEEEIQSGQLSAEEKVTSDSEEEEVDLSRESEKNDSMDMSKKIQEFFKMKAEKKGDEDGVQSELDIIFEKHEEQKKKMYDDLQSLTDTERSSIYDFGKEIEGKDLIDFQRLDILFPKDKIKDLQNFEKPKFGLDTVESIIAHEDEKLRLLESEEKNVNFLSTSAVIEIYKRKISELKEKEESFSKSDKKTINSLIELINKIGEIEIDEPRMLAKIWEVY